MKETFYSSLPLAVIIISCLFIAPLSSVADYVKITVSEPAVTVLGDQIEELTNGHIKKSTIRTTLALGIGVASLLSILKILTEINILYFLVPLYAIALVMMIFTPRQMTINKIHFSQNG